MNKKIQAIICLKNSNLFLLLKRRKDGKWSNLTGNVKTNETIKHALYREIKEETQISKKDIISIFPLFCFKYKKKNETFEETVFLVRVKTTRIDISKNPDKEHLGFAWLETKDAIKLLNHKQMKLGIEISSLINKKQ
ncbi:MAG: NUDIX hydrolase [Candidatus Rehaiarchaeum fermentans]|nr:NUDIX hydrolase [Candidatus Rehaiarchaeum fermentans]MCW1292360.1 NUDIX hydrolase [Candidatus Rehaiarchaeum fermentans]MCW1297300.1 NUDIX hydrolase [Candidatus Rehaiarchaeum fermentans]MCW1302374.1 NUDIX hydrolase [Candidatus Rehaiarchaeum fermentans]MCW1311585.1 NUDIX hydrolase [Candidatus Rehaiarchaeum fermentans]